VTETAPRGQIDGQPTTSHVAIGTSGWVYRDWRDRVYPEGMPQRQWLGYLSRRFPSIEINASFYRLPSPETFEGWARQVPEGFVFAVKMSRYLTHVRRLREPHEPLERFWSAASRLGRALGPVLFQLPPTFQRDLPRLQQLLDALPESMCAAFEFRHASWFDDDVWTTLDRAGAATVLAHTPGARVPPVVTGGWSYIRFHRGTVVGPSYRRATLVRWASRISALPAQRVYVYFNNDPGGAAVRDADRLSALLGS
jgi:uncharacterized protein YecE (DUF72 family)